MIERDTDADNSVALALQIVLAFTFIGGTQMTRGEVVTQKNTRHLVKFALNFPLDRSQAEQLRLLPGSEQRGSRRRIDPFHVAMVSQGFYFFFTKKSQVYL
jgi:hypothetical protein